MGAFVRRLWWFTGTVLTAFVVVVLAMRHGWVPWVDGAGWSPIVGMLVFGIASVVVFPRFIERSIAAAGRATLDDAGVTFEKEASGLEHRLAWSDVVGYRDAAQRWVELAPRRGAAGALTSIPTPTEADRVAVLAFLDARGLKRVE